MLFVCYEKEQTNALYIWNKSGNRVLKYVVTKYLFLDYRNFRFKFWKGTLKYKFFNKIPSSGPSNNSFSIFGSILLLKVS